MTAPEQRWGHSSPTPSDAPGTHPGVWAPAELGVFLLQGQGTQDNPGLGRKGSWDLPQPYPKQNKVLDILPLFQTPQYIGSGNNKT